MNVDGGKFNVFLEVTSYFGDVLTESEIDHPIKPVGGRTNVWATVVAMLDRYHWTPEQIDEWVLSLDFEGMLNGKSVKDGD